MRVSVEKGDPGEAAFGALPEPHGVRIFLDGKEVTDAVTADDEIGMVRALRKDADGHLVMDGGEVAIETLHGKVGIVLP